MTVFNLFDHTVNIQLPHITREDDLKAVIDNVDSLLAPSLSHGYFETPNHGKLHYRKYIPSASNLRGIVVYQHGIQGSCGMSTKLGDDDYANVGLISRKFTEAGYALYTVDMLGHGLSEGERFYIPNGDWTINRDHLEAFAQMACAEFGGVSNGGDEHENKIPLFLMGESYGGNLVLHVARMWQNHPERIPSNATFEGMVLNAPAILGDMPPPPIRWILRYVFAPIIPRSTPFFMPHPLPPERIWKLDVVREACTDPEARRRGLENSGKKMSLGTALGVVTAMECVSSEIVPGLAVPFCVHHGTMDEGVKAIGTEFLVEHCATEAKDQSVNMVEGALHNLLSDDTKDQTVETILNWMNTRVMNNDRL